MSTKGKINYWVDVVIGLAFVFSALSGLVLLIAPSGYQGGRNPYYDQTVLLLSTHVWDTVHTWSSIAMISGVGAHLVLHWDWIMCTYRDYKTHASVNAESGVVTTVIATRGNRTGGRARVGRTTDRFPGSVGRDRQIRACSDSERLLYKPTDCSFGL